MNCEKLLWCDLVTFYSALNKIDIFSIDESHTMFSLLLRLTRQPLHCTDKLKKYHTDNEYSSVLIAAIFAT